MPTPPAIAPTFPSQGWRQFLASRNDILSAYDSARTKAKTKKVQVFHGRAAESHVRKWLTEFLPKRFGITSGYVISQGVGSTEVAPHFDVIIYDALNSPVLWADDHPDDSLQGTSRAIPAEHVLAVLEVKSSFESATAKKAIEHLSEIKNLMSGVDAPNERYKVFLPPNFFCACIFVELRKASEFDETALTNLTTGADLRGFYGGIILRGEGKQLPDSGQLRLMSSETAMESELGPPKSSLLKGFTMSPTRPWGDAKHLGAMLTWGETHFANFAFDLIALLQGTFRPGFVSSFHVQGNSQWEP